MYNFRRRRQKRDTLLHRYGSQMGRISAETARAALAETQAANRAIREGEEKCACRRIMIR